MIAARNDDSSLFTLDALKRIEETAPARKQGHDDSGLIDLRALVAAEKDASSRQDLPIVAVLAPSGLFDVPAPAAPSPDTAIAPPPDARPVRGKAAFVIGGAAFALAAVVAALAATHRTPEPAPTATTMQAPQPPPAVPDPKIAAPAAMEQAAPKETATPAKPPALVKGPSRVGPKVATRTGAAKEGAGTPGAPVCDLTCQMQKAVAEKR